MGDDPRKALHGPWGGRSLDPCDTPPKDYYDVVESGCWIWNRAKGRQGYGSTRYHGRYVSAHRAYYAHYVGAIPAGMVVMHQCDSPACVNPDHLRIGTMQENQDDMASKKRSNQGMKSWSAKLTELDVRSIHLSPDTGLALAKQYGVSTATISEIRRGITWPHIYEEITGSKPKKKRRQGAAFKGRQRG